MMENTSYIPDFEGFFQCLKEGCGQGNKRRGRAVKLKYVKQAYRFAKASVAGKFRDSGERSFTHLKGAAWISMKELDCYDFWLLILILLHDLLEDSWSLKPWVLSRVFGREIRRDVEALTKLSKGKEATERYLGRIIKRGPRVILTKLCDRLHNLRTMGSWPEEKQRRYIEETLQYHLPLLIPALRGCKKKWSRYADILEQKILVAIAEVQASLAS